MWGSHGIRLPYTDDCFDWFQVCWYCKLNGHDWHIFFSCSDVRWDHKNEFLVNCLCSMCIQNRETFLASKDSSQNKNAYSIYELRKPV